MPPRDSNATTCMIRPGAGTVCYEPAHVVLFAETAGPFGGHHYATGDKVLACLKHGGQIYDAMRGRSSRTPGYLDITKLSPWLAYDVARLPVVRMPWHHTTETPARGTTRPWSNRPPRPGR